MSQSRAAKSHGDKETVLYQQAPVEAKSYLVQVFHKSHFKPSNLKKSWTKEEPLTWELYHALELLPRNTFLRPFVEAIGTIDTKQQNAVALLLSDMDKLVLTPYPLLRLSGNKRNSRSDLGFGFEEDPRLWIEVKTRRWRPHEVLQQIAAQEQALLCQANGPSSVVALVPQGLSQKVPRSLSWVVVRDVFRNGLKELKASDLSSDFLRGYVTVAEELLGRIESHEPRLLEKQS